jgi:hypothetical protein
LAFALCARARCEDERAALEGVEAGRLGVVVVARAVAVDGCVTTGCC